MLASNSFLFGAPSNYSDPFSSPENGFIIKRKRRPAGTPDPDAQVVYLTAEMLMESDRYVCEICNLSFQREQNLQMHLRRHKVPWKLKKKEEEKNEMDQVIKKRVYVCPEPSCVHHDPCHALDYKAHIKTCGTRGHSCDCGRVFSRVETFIEHQDSCKPQSTTTKECHDVQTPKPIFLPTSSSTTTTHIPHDQYSRILPNLDLELFTSPNYYNQNTHYYLEKNEHTPQSYLSSFVGQSDVHHHNYIVQNNEEAKEIIEEATTQVTRLKNEANEILKIAMEEKAMAIEKRQEAKCLIELANLEMAKAMEIRQSVGGISSSSNVMKIIKCSSCNNKQFQSVSSSKDATLTNNYYLSSSIYRR
ncbi:zinc finger protein SHOOT GRAVITROPISM 5-like isoform X2 [Solanum dulcamara]|uniref:zinc finger protein SHOOT GRAVITROPISM 5-like isoform X2 n=1 Tax=Solanum dulcamara TaxID=45834 RepID=UPI0024863924|nr:zinc finger protein SHOOT GRAVITROPISM 5-like isoform X2 [Solanum dulcamara]